MAVAESVFTTQEPILGAFAQDSTLLVTYQDSGVELQNLETREITRSWPSHQFITPAISYRGENESLHFVSVNKSNELVSWNLSTSSWKESVKIQIPDNFQCKYLKYVSNQECVLVSNHGDAVILFFNELKFGTVFTNVVNRTLKKDILDVQVSLDHNGALLIVSFPGNVFSLSRIANSISNLGNFLISLAGISEFEDKKSTSKDAIMSFACYNSINPLICILFENSKLSVFSAVIGNSSLVFSSQLDNSTRGTLSVSSNILTCLYFQGESLFTSLFSLSFNQLMSTLQLTLEKSTKRSKKQLSLTVVSSLENVYYFIGGSIYCLKIKSSSSMAEIIRSSTSFPSIPLLLAPNAKKLLRRLPADVVINSQSEWELPEAQIKLEEILNSIKNCSKEDKFLSFLTEGMKLQENNGFSWVFINTCLRLALQTSNHKLFASCAKILLPTNCCSASMCDGIISTLLSWEEIDICKLCLLHLKDISELEYAKILEFALRKPNNVKEDDVNNLIGLVVSAPRNDAFMMQSLCALNSEIVIDLLKWLVNYMEKLTKDEFPPGWVKVPTFSQFVEWTCLILDSSLHLFTESMPLLSTLQKLVSQQMSVCNKLQSLEMVVKFYAKPGKRNNKFAVPDYSLETIYL